LMLLASPLISHLDPKNDFERSGNVRFRNIVPV
jgi:hypothetical protein